MEFYSEKTFFAYPFKCPICNGNGLVPNGFYSQVTGCWNSTSTAPETCKSCNGTGIVWSK